MSGRKRDSRLPQEKKPLSHGWIVVPSKTYPDRVYFYNTISKCSTWNNPCQDNDSESSSSTSSGSSSLERNWSVKKKQKSSHVSRSKKRRGDLTLNQPDENRNTRINFGIEDSDEQNQYFNTIPIRAFSLSNSHIATPSRSSSSSSSLSSPSTNISDSEKHSDSNSLFENNKKELWVQFVSSPEKSNMKKSVALSDLQEPSTSRNSGMALSNNDKRKSGVTMNNGTNFAKNSNKKKRKKRRSMSEKSTLNEKTKKNVAFKKRDKTPAQTRLLNLRAKNAEMLQKLAAKCPELAVPTTNKKKPKHSGILKLMREGENNFHNTSVRGVEFYNNITPEIGNCSIVDFSEEMDWEPSSEESDVRNINVFRQQLEKPSQISNTISFNSDHSFELPQKPNLWLLVLDTNIFVSCLSFIKQLRDTKVPDLGYPVIYVPWRVLQELDHLKDSKFQSGLQGNVRRAIGYLNDNFKARHPRIFGQSFEDFMKMVDFEISAADDEILQTCIKLQKEHTDKKVMLLTNDKNLESKAIVSNVEVYSKDGFQKVFLKCKSPPSHPNKMNISSISNNRELKTDSCYCEAKDIFREFLSAVVETEMKIAFEGDWIKLAVKKPPWSLKDAMECLLKHWRSVFFMNFDKETQTEAELLYERLFKRETVDTVEVINMISSMQRLIASIEKSQKERRPYLDLIPSTQTKLLNVLTVLSPNYCPPQNDVGSSSRPPTASSINNESQQIPQNEEIVNEVSKVKILFKDIWDSLRGFCCSLSDIIHSSGGKNDGVIQEMRLKLSQMSNEVGELVTTVEKILEISPSEINESHPVITYFSNFLIHVYPNMVPDLKNELPKCLAMFFTDLEGRSLISRALNDFKEFIQDLSQATEYFSVQNNC